MILKSNVSASVFLSSFFPLFFLPLFLSFLPSFSFFLSSYIVEDITNAQKDAIGYALTASSTPV